MVKAHDVEGPSNLASTRSGASYTSDTEFSKGTPNSKRHRASPIYISGRVFTRVLGFCDAPEAAPMEDSCRTSSKPLDKVY